MPTATYEQLLIEAVPEVIETEKQYREIGDRFGDLQRARNERERLYGNLSGPGSCGLHEPNSGHQWSLQRLR